MVTPCFSRRPVTKLLLSAISSNPHLTILLSRSVCTKQSTELNLANVLTDHGFSTAQVETFVRKNYAALNFDSFDVQKSLHILASFGILRKDIFLLITSCPSVLDSHFLNKWKIGFSHFRESLISSSVVKNLLECSRRTLIDPDKFEVCLRALRDLGLEDTTVVRVLESFPAVIGLRESEIHKNVGFLRDIGIEKDMVDRIIYLFPEFFSIGVEGRLLPLLGELESMGFSKTTITKEINKDPRILSLEPGELSRYLQLLKALKCREGIKLKILSNGEFRAGFEVKRRVDCLCRHGLIRREALTIIWKEPRVIIYSVSDIEKKIEFLIKTMHFSVDCLVDVPEYLGVNFEKQIVPRCNVILHLLSKNALADHVRLASIIKLSRQRFYNYYVKPYPECEKMYGKVSESSAPRTSYPTGLWKLLKPERPPHSDNDVKNFQSFMENFCLVGSV